MYETESEVWQTRETFRYLIVFFMLIETIKQQYSELEDDRAFLDYEIRDSRLHNKMLKIALSKQHN